MSPQFRGPPNSGNGGYVCGLLAEQLPGAIFTGILRAPIPLDVPLRIELLDGAARLVDAAGGLIAEARAGEAGDLPEAPPAPSLDAATAAGGRFIGLQRTFHPICFTCATSLEEGYGLRVFVGQV